MSYFGGAEKIGEFTPKLLESLSTDCNAAAGEFANNCTNEELMKLCTDRATKMATEGSNMYIIIGIAVVLLICCCIYCCCSSSGVYYWNKSQTTKEETK